MFAVSDRSFGLAVLVRRGRDTWSTLARLLNKFFPKERQPAEVHVRVHRAQRTGPSTGEAYFVAVANTSPEPVTVRHVLLNAAGTTITVLTRPLPATIGPGQQWETWIDARELPPGSVDVEHSFWVILADDSLIGSMPREENPAGAPPG